MLSQDSWPPKNNLSNAKLLVGGAEQARLPFKYYPLTAELPADGAKCLPTHGTTHLVSNANVVAQRQCHTKEK